MTEWIVPGADCTVNSSRDLYMIEESRSFIDKPCVVLKITKSGLVQVALKSDMRKTMSFPKYNISKPQGPRHD